MQGTGRSSQGIEGYGNCPIWRQRPASGCTANEEEEEDEERRKLKIEKGGKDSLSHKHAKKHTFTLFPNKHLRNVEEIKFSSRCQNTVQDSESINKCQFEDISSIDRSLQNIRGVSITNVVCKTSLGWCFANFAERYHDRAGVGRPSEGHALPADTQLSFSSTSSSRLGNVLRLHDKICHVTVNKENF